MSAEALVLLGDACAQLATLHGDGWSALRCCEPGAEWCNLRAAESCAPAWAMARPTATAAGPTSHAKVSGLFESTL